MVCVDAQKVCARQIAGFGRPRSDLGLIDRDHFRMVGVVRERIATLIDEHRQMMAPAPARAVGHWPT
jgi:hypothetical protein